MAFQDSLKNSMNSAIGVGPGGGMRQRAAGAVGNRVQGDMNRLARPINSLVQKSPILSNSPLLNHSPLMRGIGNMFGGGADKVQKGLGPGKPVVDNAMAAPVDMPPPPMAGGMPEPPMRTGGMEDQLAAQQAAGPVMQQGPPPPPMMQQGAIGSMQAPPPDAGLVGGLGPQAPAMQNMMQQKKPMMPPMKGMRR